MVDNHPDGWYPDPWKRWPERYFQAGYYTDRVRYGAVEGRDSQWAPPSPAPSGHGSGYGQHPPAPGYRPPGYPGPAQGQFGPGAPLYASPLYAPQSYGYGYGQPKAGTVKTGPLPLHPMNIGDVLDGAFRLYRANFLTVITIVAVIAGPIELLSALGRRGQFGGQGFFSILANPSSAQNTGSSGLSPASGLASLVSLLMLPYAAGAISRVVAASYLGQSETAGTALRASLSRFFPLLGAWFVVHLLEVVGGVLLVLPGLIFMALCVCTAPAIVMENLGPIQGIRRSWNLNRHRMWTVMGTALLSGIVISIVGNIIGAPLQIAALAIGLRWGWILLFLGLLLANLVVLALNAIVATLIYFDGRIRYEALDLQILARGLQG